jgi:O-antigen/teichoic acid export membrane protein
MKTPNAAGLGDSEPLHADEAVQPGHTAADEARERPSDISEAKRRLLVNVVSNFGVVFANAVITIALTPFMIRHLGLDAYGMVPLVVSFTTYLQVVTGALADAVARYVAIPFGRGDIAESNVYFSSALYALLGLCGLLTLPTIVVAMVFTVLFQVPSGHELAARYLFILVILSSFLTVLHTPFRVSAIITHRFYLSNLVETGGRVLRAVVILACFLYVAPSLTYVGLAYAAMGAFILAGTVALARRLTPQLRLGLARFRWRALREMAGMSSWIALNQVGSLLYIPVSFVVLNVLVGPEAVGRFGVVALWITLLGTLGGAFSTVFAPIAYEHVARGDSSALVRQTRRAIRLLGLVMGCVIGLMCGLAHPILHVWLGADFASLWPLVGVLIGPWLFTIAVRPVFAVYRALDTVRLPAIVTVALGAINLIASVLLLWLTPLGVYAVALSLAACWLLKNLLFTPLYTAAIMRQHWTVFLAELGPAALMTAALAGLGFAVASYVDIASLPRLTAVTLALCGVYALACHQVVLDADDRALLRTILRRRATR